VQDLDRRRILFIPLLEVQATIPSRPQCHASTQYNITTEMEFSTDSTCLLSGVEPLQLVVKGGIGVVAGSPNVNRRGIAMTLGPEEDHQPFSVRPNINHNNTFVSSDERCKDSGLGCVAEAGGVYTYTANQGARTFNGLGQWNGTHGRDVDGTSATSYAYFNDLAGIGATTIHGLPFATVTNYSG